MKQIFTLLPTLLLFLSACQQQPKTPIFDDGTSQLWNVEQAPFYHSVASGDPTAQAVIIWTRVTPEFEGEVKGSWTVAGDKEMQNIVQQGEFTTNADRDYTVKIDVQGLEPDTYFYYQFAAFGKKSPVGRTKTAPTDSTDQVKLAIVSCSNYEGGFFNAFGRIAEIEDLDAVLHLGDYIYEYAVGVYGDTTLGRHHLPNKELVALQDYRTRYSQYRLDPDFQLAHQMQPFITIWDDHEISNNAYQSGAQNHQPDEEGDYEIRKSAARQAYYEWLPIRENETQQLYRNFSYGKLVDLIMLDERLAGRYPQVDSVTQEDYNNPERSMLGKEQLAWFKNQLQQSQAQWKVIGNQVIFSNLDITAVGWRGLVNTDAWDGYPAEQKEIIQLIKNNSIPNIIFVTGDTHRNWAFEVPESIAAYKQNPDATVAVELGTTSISAPNADERQTTDEVLEIERRSMDPLFNPHLKYNNQRDHGYILLAITADSAVANFQVVESIKTPNTNQRTDKTAIVKNGSHKLIIK